MTCEHRIVGLRERSPVLWEDGQVCCRECAETYSDTVVEPGKYEHEGVIGRLV